jgi:MFS family permease
MKKIFTYENKLLALMSISFGFVFFDRMAVPYLSPFIVKDLHLSNTQIGLLISGLSITWALSGYFFTAWAEANNRKKIVFVVSVVLFSLCSISSGWALTFGALLLTRLLMGLFEGPTLPLIQSFIAKESSKGRLGFNMGFLQSFGSTLFGFLIAPVLLVVIAEKLGWRSAFFIAGIPGLILAFINWKFIRKTTAENSITKEDGGLSIGELWKFKNIRVGVLVSCCLLVWINCGVAFLPQFIVEVQHLPEGEVGKIMGLMGVSSLLSGIIVPTLSDKYGRKLLIQIFIAVGIFYPLAIVFLQNSGVQLPAMFITYFLFGTVPVVLSAIPSETVPVHSTGKAIGLLAGAGEIAGGVIAPVVAGILADKYGLEMPFYIASAAAVVALFASFYFIETKSSIVK